MKSIEFLLILHPDKTGREILGFKKIGNIEGVNRMEAKAAIYIKVVADIKEAIERESKK